MKLSKEPNRTYESCVSKNEHKKITEIMTNYHWFFNGFRHIHAFENNMPKKQNNKQKKRNLYNTKWP